MPQGSQDQRAINDVLSDLLLARLRVLPGVESASLVENRPGTGWSNNDRAIVDGVEPLHPDGRFAPVRHNVVGPEFFHVLGTPVLLGRGITEADTAASPRVAVVNETFAKRYLPQTNPLGHRVGHPKTERTIVGVVGNNKYTGLDEKVYPDDVDAVHARRPDELAGR